MPSRSRRVDAARPGRPGRYGCTTEDEFANNYLRAAGAWMLQYAVLLSLDPETVIWKSMFCASGTLLAYARPPRRSKGRGAAAAGGRRRASR